MLEEIYGGVQYLGKKGKLGECKRSSQRIQERILARYRRYSKIRVRKRSIQTRRISGKIYGKKTIWVVGQTV